MTTVPAPDENTAPWWAGTTERQLLVQHCEACGRYQHPPRAVCTDCGGAAFGWPQASGRGVIDSWTIVRRAPLPDLEAPYVVARVRLAEGPILLTHIDVPVEDAPSLSCGLAVRLSWRELADGRALPVFQPAAALPETTPQEN